MTPDQLIWTLNARESVLLDVLADYFNLSDIQVRREIQGAHETLLGVLAEKRIDYQALRSALVPKADRLEGAFVFDSAMIDSNWYGYEVASRLVPLIHRQTTCSFLSGDLIADDQDMAFSLLQYHLQLHKPCEIAHTSQLYCIYMNSLSETMARTIHEGLIPYEPYVGYIDATFASPMKNWLSGTLVHCYVKTRNTFLGPHEDDVPNEEDRNLRGWPLDDHGYVCRSLQSTYFDLFLSYKIERAVLPGFESDTKFSLSAISDSPQDLSGFSVFVEEAKAEYLRQHKRGSLKRAGLDNLTSEQLQALIKSKVNQNYIYHLRFKEDEGVSLFNLLLEVANPSRGNPLKLETPRKRGMKA